jgi:aspartyl-tRNA(Asn)/glutamyl-tRNA(Gln) amidotransferase subunit A
MTDWSRASLTDTADAIASGKVSSREVVEATLARIKRLNPLLNSFVQVDADAAMAAADRADGRQQKGDPLGPLHGVPLAHKDMFYAPERPSECGSRVRGKFEPGYRATVLERLDRAGAIELGRLAMVEFAMGPHGYNANYPQCRNAWNTDYIPCGSSSGSGVAVAARLAHGSLGSDTGGSIRCPAAVSGVTGLVPTYGRVSRHGVMPMSFSLDVAGPLARTARDCARMLTVVAGVDSKDSSSLAVPVPAESDMFSSERPLPRIGIARGYFDENVHPDIHAAHDRALDEFRKAGLEIVEVRMPVGMLSEMAELHPLVMKAEGAANHLDMMRERQQDYTFEVGQRLHAGFFITAADYIRALKIRGMYLREFVKAAFSTCDVIFAPVLASPVPTIAETSGKTGKDYLDLVVSLTRNTKIVNYLGLPAMSVPCGFSGNGMPVSFQLIGRPLADATLLRAADIFQNRTPWHEMEPQLV